MVKNNEGVIGKYFYYAYSIAFVAFLIYSLLFKKSAIIDVFICFSLYLVVFFLFKKYGFTNAAFLLLAGGVSLHLLGLFFWYDNFLFGPVGYDKLVHFFSSFAGAYAFLTSNIDRKNNARYLIIILMVMGFGAIVEVNEFIGSTYFGVTDSGILTQGDGLPIIKSDLQTHDTYFDMMFNFAGSSVCVIYFILIRKIKSLRN